MWNFIKRKCTQFKNWVGRLWDKTSKTVKKIARVIVKVAALAGVIAMVSFMVPIIVNVIGLYIEVLLLTAALGVVLMLVRAVLEKAEEEGVINKAKEEGVSN